MKDVPSFSPWFSMFLGLREQAIRWDQDEEGNWTGATNQVTAQPTADTTGQQQTLAAIQSLTEQVARLASLVASGQSQAPRASPTPKQPTAEMAVQLQQALAEAKASIKSLTEQVARLQSLVVQGQNEAPNAAPVKAHPLFQVQGQRAHGPSVPQEAENRKRQAIAENLLQDQRKDPAAGNRARH